MVTKIRQWLYKEVNTNIREHVASGKIAEKRGCSGFARVLWSRRKFAQTAAFFLSLSPSLKLCQPASPSVALKVTFWTLFWNRDLGVVLSMVLLLRRCARLFSNLACSHSAPNVWCIGWIVLSGHVVGCSVLCWPSCLMPFILRWSGLSEGITSSAGFPKLFLHGWW